MALTDEEIEKCLDVLKALNDAVDQGPWDKTLLLQGIGKKLLQARENFIKDLGLEELLAKETAVVQNPAQIAHDALFVEIYISLYQAEGNNINKWATLVSSLAQLSITRPTYRNEADISSSIRAKAFQLNDAYVAVKIRKDDILQPKDGKAPVDRTGCELLVLRENVIRPENVTRFIHVSGQYRYIKGVLIKII